jgi:hypothetical protein
MEFLLDLLPALFIFWFVLRAVRGAGRRRARQTGSAQSAQVQQGRPATAYSGFEELVRRLELAAAEAQERQQVVQSAPPALSVRVEAPPPVRPSEDEFAFRSVESTQSEFSYVGGLGEGVQPTEFHETHPLDYTYSQPGESAAALAAPARVHPLVERLRSPASAREALLLKDVLSAPRSRSGGRR